MASSDGTISLREVIAAIKKRQPVLNTEDFDDAKLLLEVSGIGNIETADESQLSFLSDKAYISKLSTTSAAAVIVSEAESGDVPSHSIPIIVPSPYIAYATVSQLFDYQSDKKPQNLESKLIHDTAQISASAEIEDNVQVGPYCIISDGVKIGSGTQLKSHVHVDANSEIGQHCEIFSNVVIGHQTVIGDSVRIHPGAIIGAEGFGFAPLKDPATDGWERIVQLGRVIIGNGVRIGSNTCIDRGAINDTVIGDNVIIDNLVQIGHNVKIGAGTALAGNVGIAGSAVIGKRCMIGGGVGIAGHLSIADDVVLTGMTLVSKSIKKPGVYSSGVSSMPAMDWRRTMVKLRSLGKKT